MKIWFNLVIPPLLALSACSGTVVTENSGAATGPSATASGPSGSSQMTAAGAGGADVGGVGGADVTSSAVSVGAGGSTGCAPGTVEMNGQCVPANLSAKCLGGGNVIYLNGESGELIHPGEETITQGQWSAVLTTATHVGIDFDGTSPGIFWWLDFSSEELPGAPPLAAQLYTNAMRYPFEDPGSPGISIAGDGLGCNTNGGQFQIETISFEGETLKAFTATFEQTCDGFKPLLRGCVHFEQ